MELTVCPYLGLYDDPTLIRTAATESHRCFARKPPAAPDLEYQGRFCLAARHTACVFFPQQPPAADAGVIVPNPARGALAAPAPLFDPSASALPSTLSAADLDDSDDEEEEDERGGASRNWLALFFAALVVLAAGAVLLGIGLEWLRPVQAEGTPEATPLLTATLPPSPTITATPVPPPASPAPAGLLLPTPTPLPGGATYTIVPRGGEAGWWASGDSRANHLGDSFLYAGNYQGQDFLAIARFDLARIPRGAPIEALTLRLTGLDDQRLARSGSTAWLVQLLPENATTELNRADYLAALSAPAAFTLPPLAVDALRVTGVNEFEFDELVRRWLEQQLLDGATSVAVRILASGGADSIFAWDSGQGPQSSGASPELILRAGPPPPTPPPLPTKPFIVATLTPVPQNVVTVVAQAETATAVAQTTGTYTPLPYQVYTPTPFPENLATVQAVALLRGLPPVLLNTPTPANAATATADAFYATAVALTTGTFTPVPAGYVTPIVIPPSPPAENIATAAARVLAATATAEAAAGSLLATPTPTVLPYNAVIGVYVYATAAPENVATAVAFNQQLELIYRTTGTPTPLPWNAIVITRVPTPPPPPPTPIPLFIGAEDFTPTPTPTATGTPPADLPPEVRGKILFKSDRSGSEGTYMLDPATGAVTLITQGWVYSLARQQLTQAPDGVTEVQVRNDSTGKLQIHTYSPLYGSVRQVTALNGANYDPAWSPAGDWIAFVSTETGGDEIYRVDPAGAVAQRLTFNAWEWDKHPSWSPDGSQIVFYSNRDTGRRQLWIMAADGAGQRNLSSNEYNDWDPVWVR